MRRLPAQGLILHLGSPFFVAPCLSQLLPSLILPCWDPFFLIQGCTIFCVCAGSPPLSCLVAGSQSLGLHGSLGQHEDTTQFLSSPGSSSVPMRELRSTEWTACPWPQSVQWSRCQDSWLSVLAFFLETLPFATLCPAPTSIPGSPCCSLGRSLVATVSSQFPVPEIYSGCLPWVSENFTSPRAAGSGWPQDAAGAQWH